ncbi:hypothetical protein, conserved [Eimeria necatrix]|uniref:Uncharacterized protein n=1 Tax=Eimeria necatrix TaxID=51315 RepID=U6MPZ7_9EIME|nr:hypothetical protein, conserved [Eimeria necatrix]CDJ66302.1 hypothetical protein, conserved [Eimeria necatrix]
MAALCRKYERPEVELPSVCTVSEEELKTWSKESQKLHASLKEAMETAGEESAALQNFMKKISKVTLEA